MSGELVGGIEAKGSAPSLIPYLEVYLDKLVIPVEDLDSGGGTGGRTATTQYCRRLGGGGRTT